MRLLLLLLLLRSAPALHAGEVSIAGAKEVVTSPIYTNSFLVSTNPGRAFKVLVHNSSAAAVWLHVFDSATNKLAGAVPDLAPKSLAANATEGFDFDCSALPFARGLLVAGSTTDRTLTNVTDVLRITVTTGPP